MKACLGPGQPACGLGFGSGGDSDTEEPPQSFLSFALPALLGDAGSTK